MTKETFTKQRFWFCLGGFVLVFLIALVTVKVSAGPKTAEKEKKYEDSKKNLNVHDPKSPSFWEPWEKAKEEYSKHINIVWSRAWDLQKDMSVWPESLPTAPFQKWWKDADSWDDWRNKASGSASNEARDAYGRKLYKAQFIKLLQDLNTQDQYAKLFDKNKPDEIREAKIGSVDFNDGLAGYKVMMLPALAGGGGPERGRPAPGAAQEKRRNVDNVFVHRPTLEECWYAQEDFWLKREILQTVKRTVEAVAKFSREEPGFWAGVTHRIEYPERVFSPLAKPKENAEKGGDYIGRQRFRNPNWEIDLLFVKEGNNVFVSGHSTIRNVSGRTQPLNRPASNDKPVKGDKGDKNDQVRGPLQFNIRQGDGNWVLRIIGEDLPADKDAEVKETIPVTWDGKGSFDPQKPFEMEQVFDWYTAPVRRVEDIKTCVHSNRTANFPLKPHNKLYKPEPPPTQTAQAGGAPQPAGAQPPANVPAPPTEANGLERNRYLNVTDTARDLPFAVVLVVEQSHIHDFLVELANSRLRIQITQVEFRRLRNVGPIPPPPPEARTPDGRRPPQGQEPPQATVKPKLDQNLVEVTVYGIAALYEKYPVKKPDAKTE